MIRIGPVVCITLIIFLFATVIFFHIRSIYDKQPSIQEHPLVPLYGNLMLMFYFIFVAVIIHSITRTYEIRTPDLVFLVIIGFVIGVAAYHHSVVNLAANFMDIRSNDLLYIYVPVTVFNLSFCMDFHIFLKSLPQCVIVSIPVCLLTGALFGELTRLVINFSWSHSLALTMGLYSGPILPKKITKILKFETTKTKHTGVLLESEAVLSFIVIDICQIIAVGIVSETLFRWYQFLSVILRIILLGCLVGYCFGLLGQYLIRKMYSDHLSVFLVCFIMPFLTYSLSFSYIVGCGSISVMVMGIMLSMERALLPKQLENTLMNFWECVGSILNIIVIARCSMRIAVYSTANITGQTYALVVVVYVLHYAARMFCFFIFLPILSRLGYGMGLKSMVVFVWLGLKNPYSLEIFQFYAIHCASPLLSNESAHLVFVMLSLFFLSHLINGTFAITVVDFMGMRQVSFAAQVNMNNCIKHLFEKRERTLTILKMDRILADTNWPLVVQMTNIQHPYQMRLRTTEADEVLGGYRFTYCSECHKDIRQQPTKKELREMLKEAKMRILKAMQMSYSRQYENGMISKEGIRILSQAIELAMDSEECVVKVSDLEKQFVEEGWFRRFVRKRAERLAVQDKNLPKRPRTYWRRVCYNHIIKHTRFEKIMMVVVVVNVVIILADLYNYPSLFATKNTRRHGIELDYFLLISKCILAIIYIVEMVMRILAYSWKYICAHGCKTYFKNVWNIIDFLALIGLLMGIMGSHHIENVLSVDRFVRRISDFLQLLRLIRLFRAFNILYPDVIQYLNKTADSKMAFTYELGKGYVNGGREVLDKLPYMIDNKDIRDDMKARIESDCILITKLLGNVQKERPWIAITVKTKQSIRTILTNMNEAMYSLKSAGWIDSYEHEKLQFSMSNLYKDVNSIKKVNPSPPKVIFKEVSWMNNDDSVIDFLFENVTVKNFDPGDIVFTEGQVADRVYIVVTGLFLISYKPNTYILQSLHEYGKLPIADYFSATQYEEESVDYIVSGNCIGELSVLTGRPYNCTITAEAYSQVYVLSRGVLKRAMELSPDPVVGLECRIWKEVGVRVSLPLLLSVPVYQTLSQDQIKYALERAFVPDLSNYKIFAVTDMIEQIVLIEGTAVDFHTRENFVAPCCIPRNVQKLILPVSSLMNIPIDIETKLLLIPEKDVDEYDVMMLAEETCEMVNNRADSKCLQHIAIQRSTKKSKKNRFESSLKRGRRQSRVAPSETISLSTSGSRTTRSNLSNEEERPLMFYTNLTKEPPSLSFHTSSEEPEEDNNVEKGEPSTKQLPEKKKPSFGDEEKKVGDSPQPSILSSKKTQSGFHDKSQVKIDLDESDGPPVSRQTSMKRKASLFIFDEQPRGKEAEQNEPEQPTSKRRQSLFQLEI